MMDYVYLVVALISAFSHRLHGAYRLQSANQADAVRAGVLDDR
jgi:hypothetical protein